MRAALAKSIVILALLAATPDVHAKYDVNTWCPSGYSRCYCNGLDAGCFPVAMPCYLVCGSALNGLDSSKSLNTLQPELLTEQARLERFLVSLSE